MKALIIFVIAIVNNQGQMQMEGYYVEQCPDKVEFAERMDGLVKKGQMKDWHAVRIETGKQGQDT